MSKVKQFTHWGPNFLKEGSLDLAGNYYFKDCVNCGKRNLIMDDDPYDVKCEFGEHKVRIPERIKAWREQIHLKLL